MQIKKIVNSLINNENSYEKSVENFNISTEKMNDDFISYRVEQNVMMWLNEKGVLGEIECIFPSQVDKEVILKVKEESKEVRGLPLIDTEKNLKSEAVSVFASDAYFVIYLSQSKQYDKKVISQNLEFYLNHLEVIAIKASL